MQIYLIELCVDTFPGATIVFRRILFAYDGIRTNHFKKYIN